MKIKYKLVKVQQNTYYSELKSSDASYDFSSEIMYVQKDSEKEVEKWLEDALAAASIVKEAEYNYYWAGLNRAGRIPGAKSPAELSALYELHQELLENYRTKYGYDLIDTSSEYRIVKIYTLI